MEFMKPNGVIRFLPHPFEACLQIFDEVEQERLECKGPNCLVCMIDGNLFAVALVQEGRSLLEQLVILGQLVKRSDGVVDAATKYLGRKD